MCRRIRRDSRVFRGWFSTGPMGLKKIFGGRFPKALPWAIFCQPCRLSIRVYPRIAAWPPRGFTPCSFIPLCAFVPLWFNPQPLGRTKR